MDEARLIEFPQHGDERGHLVVVESGQEIPFGIQRVFYIYGSDADVVRGKHANLNTEFVLINISGTSKVKVEDQHGVQIFSLDRPHVGIYLPRMCWKEMYDFSPDSVLLCLASTHYDDKEYIRSYDDFKEMMDRIG